MIIKESKEYMKWFKKLKDERVKTVIYYRTMMIMNFNHFGDTKAVGDNIFELRIHIGAGYRIYYTIKGNEVVYLLSGGDKSTQEKDIEKARRIAKEV